MRLHFISGLPRAGSTLLSALLKQNPRFHAGMSGPMGILFVALLGQMSGSNEFAVFVNETQKKAILKGVFENYYAAATDKVVFDTNRVWCSKMPALAELFPDAKMIACVRQTAWIVDSIESLIRRNAFEMSKIFNFDAGGTVFSRAEGVSKAAEAMKAVYDLVGEKPFAHDFDNVEFDAEEFDTRLGTPGLYRVRRQVKTEPRETILPPEIFRRYDNDNFWEDPALNKRGVRVV